MQPQNLKNGALYILAKDITNPFADKRARYDASKQAVFEAGSVIQVRIDEPNEPSEDAPPIRLTRVDLRIKKNSDFWDTIVTWFMRDDEPLKVKRDEDDTARATLWADMIASLEERPRDVDTVYSEVDGGSLNITRDALQWLVDEKKLTLDDLKAALEVVLNRPEN